MFEWDPNKEAKNIRKHGISFEEAALIFDDPMSITVIDEEHSIDEERYITIGLSTYGRLLMVAHTDRQGKSLLSAHVKPLKMRINFMHNLGDNDDYDLHDEYDLSSMRIVAKGRYAPQRRFGKNVVLLAPDVIEAFSTDDMPLMKLSVFLYKLRRFRTNQNYRKISPLGSVLRFIFANNAL